MRHGRWAALLLGGVCVGIPAARTFGSDCGLPVSATPRTDYVPAGSIPDGLREPSDPDPTTPTTPELPPTPATPTTTPSVPPTPTATPTTPVTPGSASGAGDATGGVERDRDGGRRAARDDSAWEVWWAVHRFEFLEPADHSAQWTGEGKGTPFEATRRAVRPRLLQLGATSQDYRLRGAAIAAALRLSSPEEADAMGDVVRRSLRSHNLELAMSVGNALSYSSARPLIPAVHPVASDEVVEAHVRGLIALAIPGLWPDASDGLLVRLLERDSRAEPAYTEGVLMALGSAHGAEGTAALERIVRDGAVPPVLRATALTSLARRGLDARALLVASIDDQRVEVRRAAVTGLGILPWAVSAPDAGALAALRRAGGSESAEALEAMIQRLSSERTDALLDGPIRDACLRLGRVLLKEHDRSVRAAAAVSLGRIARASGSPNAVRLLVADLARTRDLREYVLIALAISRDVRAVPICVDALRAPSAPPTTRAAAAIALGILGAELARSPLQRVLLDDANPQVRGYAAVALGMLEDASALGPIRRGFETTRSVDAAGQFAIALGLFGEAQDGTRLATRFARGGSRPLLVNLVEALRLLGQVGPTKALLAIAEDSESDAAPQAARALAGILAPNDAGKPERVRAFDHIQGEDYLLAYVVDP